MNYERGKLRGGRAGGVEADGTRLDCGAFPEYMSAGMFPVSKIVLKFSVVAFAMTVLCSMLWDVFVFNRIYTYTDAMPCGFVFPGHWVSDSPDDPVKVVDKVVAAQSLSDPDEIKRGWSNARIWGLWWGFTATGLCISVMLTRVPWSGYFKYAISGLLLAGIAAAVLFMGGLVGFTIFVTLLVMWPVWLVVALICVCEWFTNRWRKPAESVS